MKLKCPAMFVCLFVCVRKIAKIQPRPFLRHMAHGYVDLTTIGFNKVYSYVPIIRGPQSSLCSPISTGVLSDSADFSNQTDTKLSLD